MSTKSTGQIKKMPKITDYTFKDVAGGIIVNREGQTVAAVFDGGLAHLNDAAWNEFQSIASTYVANMIKAQSK
jgi:hypothetical protein